MGAAPAAQQPVPLSPSCRHLTPSTLIPALLAPAVLCRDPELARQAHVLHEADERSRAICSLKLDWSDSLTQSVRDANCEWPAARLWLTGVLLPNAEPPLPAARSLLLLAPLYRPFGLFCCCTPPQPLLLRF